MDNNGGTVMIVEDNEKQLDIYQSMLPSMKKYEVLAATTLSEARRLLCNTQPDVILLDIDLPDGSGIDFCCEIRNETAAAIIFVTGKPEREYKQKGLDVGGDDYITKPFTMSDLFTRIESVRKRKRYQRR